MAWKKDGENIAVKDGHPIWVYDDGNESPFDAGSALKKISEVNTESKNRKLKIKELEASYEPFKNIGNPVEYLSKANSAITTIDDFKDKEADKIASIKKGLENEYKALADASKLSYETKMNELNKSIEDKDLIINTSVIKNILTNSKFIKEKTTMTAFQAFDSFAKNFIVKDTNAIAVRDNGEKIFSLKNAGSNASAEEALEILISERPDRDFLLKANATGGGTTQQGGILGRKTILRFNFDELSPSEQTKYIKEGGQVTE